jgi:anti-sigma B factor antagonist
MTVHVQFVNDEVWSVTPQGRIDVPAARSLDDALSGLLDEGHARIVVDFTEATYIASSGLKTVLNALRRARGLGGEVCLAAMNERVSEIFEMAGFDRVFTVFSSPTEAIQSFKK